MVLAWYATKPRPHSNDVCRCHVTTEIEMTDIRKKAEEKERQKTREVKNSFVDPIRLGPTLYVQKSLRSSNHVLCAATGSHAEILGFVLEYRALVTKRCRQSSGTCILPAVGKKKKKINSRAIRLESTPRLRIIRNGVWLLKLAQADHNEGVLGGRLIQRVRHPRVPAGFDVRGVVVVLGVFDPAGSEG